jgi:hypothetical protein
MPSGTIKRQPVNEQKRKCTRADPTQTRILLKNYESQARPSSTQFADISLETNLCAVLFTFTSSSDGPFVSLCHLPTFSPCRPVEWIKKWFLRKRKADGKNRPLAPTTTPTFVENEPPAHDGQTLGHVHSKFWSVDAFVAADSNSFSPSVGHIPKFHGHLRHGLPPGNPDDRTTDSGGRKEEGTVMFTGVSAGTGDSCTAPYRKSVETATLTTYDLREALLGADAFTGYLSPSAHGDTSKLHIEGSNVALAVNDTGSTLLPGPDALSTECTIYPDDTHDEAFSGSESATDLEFTPADHTVLSMSSSLDTIDGFILASRDLELISATSCDTSKYFELGSFDSTNGHLDSDLGSLPGFLDVSDHTTSALGESSAFYESLLLQTTNQDPMGESINLTDCSDLLAIDFRLGAGEDHFSSQLVGFEFRD